MNEEARVTVTFLFSFSKSDLGLDENATSEEFETAVKEYMKYDIDYSSFEPNDIEVEVI
jgi:hypothetical protein